MHISAPRRLAWGAFAAALVLAPMVFRGGLALSVLSQIGYLAIICLSYNLLFGQGGMLSFGHAVYSGLGSIVAIHAMRLAAGGAVPLPLPLVPLAGGLGGMVFALLFGYVSTRRSGTTFAMITLGLGELAAATALMFPDFFGGEGGIAADRVYGTPWLGLTFGPAIEVYYLIAAYCLACAALMHAFTGTPLGRILNAVRDNPERAEFIGYNPRRVRCTAFVIAGFFAGIGGALAAINFEIVNAADSLGAARSGSYLLFTFLGGATFFFGPIIGAVLLVLASIVLSALTKAWLLYLGLAFLFMVMFAPGGVASLVMANLRVARFGRFRPFWALYAALAGAAAPALAGGVALVEMTYHLQLDAALGPGLRFLGLVLDTSAPRDWLAAASLLAVGAALLEAVRRRFARAWDQVQQDIEACIARQQHQHQQQQQQEQEQEQEQEQVQLYEQRQQQPPLQRPIAAASDALPGGRHPSASAMPPALELRALRRDFGKTAILRGVDLAVHAGERVAVIGPNGAGKSTLFNLVSGRAAPSGGQVLLHGRRIDGLNAHQINRLGLARSFQVTHVFPRLSVFENLRCGVLWSLGHRYSFWRRLSRLDDANARAEQLMRQLALAHRRDVAAMHLTYAEQRALEIGVTIGGGAGVILLDEPTAGMSRGETARFVELIKDATAGRTLVMVEHDMGVVFGLAERIAVLVRGEIIAFDTPEAVRADPRVQAAYLGPPDAQPWASAGHA
jgi:branched-chain amino acid transport system permease protein